MTAAAPRPPRAGRALVLAAAAALLAAGPRPAVADQVHDNADLNYFFHVPDTFKWGDVSPFRAKGVVELADRVLETLADKDRTKATGQGVRAMLAVTEAKDSKDVNPDYEGDLFDWQQLEEKAKRQDLTEAENKASEDLKLKIEKSLAELASKPDIQQLLLERFDKKSQPKAEVEAVNERVGPIPAAVVKVEGTCANLAGNDGPCVGRLFVFILRGKLYRLVMWAFPTPKDREHLSTNLDEIQFSFEFSKTEARPKKPPKPGGTDDKVDPKSQEDADKKARKIITDPAYGFQVVKPQGFVEQPFDRATSAQREVGFNFNASSTGAYANVDLIVKRIGRAGVMAWDRNVYLPGLWNSWLTDHKEGAIGTLPFPPYTAKLGFLVLPDYSKKKDKDSVIDRPKPKDPKKPNEVEPVTIAEMQRLGVCDEVHNAKFGETKIHEVWRFCMTGNLPRVGEDIQMQFCFSSPTRTYVLRVITRYDGSFEAYKPAITELLGSFKILND